MMNKTQTQRCHDCNVEEGQFHQPGCDMERCPFCGNQLISCPCCYELLGFNYDWNAPNCGLPEEIYMEGLPPELQKKWDSILKEKGLIPYFLYPYSCARCAEQWCDMFKVPDPEWNHYIEPAQRNSVICRPCYDEIKEKTDKNIMLQKRDDD